MNKLIILLSPCICLLLFFCQSFSNSQKAPDDQAQNAKSVWDEYKKERREMVDQQIRARGISDGSVLKAMEKVPRHKFVPSDRRHLAYRDHPLPIGQNQTISQPFIVAYMTEVADISKKDKVLEIGTGSGYQAAILGELAKEVYTIEIIPELAEGASKVLDELGYKNIFVKTGNGYLGLPEQAPFDAIIVTAAPDEVPKALIEQLAVDGKMVIPVGDTNQEMTVIKKTKKGVTERRTMQVRFVPMTGKPS
ncbi:MAG: protein-L-isoaspartate(D-aspartate) O-methyltransferase [Acidobacteriota bacterium]|nr:protein-L-isoaspartate(D-aspartate) O-methyltransferase [Acidobacteriota bacterium]